MNFVFFKDLAAQSGTVCGSGQTCSNLSCVNNSQAPTGKFILKKLLTKFWFS